MDRFSTILQTAKANYSTTHGVILNLRSSNKRIPITLCVSTRRNRSKIVPTDCIVWSKDRILYQGTLNGKRLRNLIEKSDLCCIEVTNAVDMDYGPGKYICLNDKNTCQCTSCLCHKQEDISSVQCSDAVSYRTHVLDELWRQGIKESRKTLKAKRKEALRYATAFSG